MIEDTGNTEPLGIDVVDAVAAGLSDGGPPVNYPLIAQAVAGILDDDTEKTVKDLADRYREWFLEYRLQQIAVEALEDEVPLSDEETSALAAHFEARHGLKPSVSTTGEALTPESATRKNKTRRFDSRAISKIAVVALAFVAFAFLAQTFFGSNEERVVKTELRLTNETEIRKLEASAISSREKAIVLGHAAIQAQAAEDALAEELYLGAIRQFEESGDDGGMIVFLTAFISERAGNPRSIQGLAESEPQFLKLLEVVQRSGSDNERFWVTTQMIVWRDLKLLQSVPKLESSLDSQRTNGRKLLLSDAPIRLRGILHPWVGALGVARLAQIDNDEQLLQESITRLIVTCIKNAPGNHPMRTDYSSTLLALRTRKSCWSGILDQHHGLASFMFDPKDQYWTEGLAYQKRAETVLSFVRENLDEKPNECIDQLVDLLAADNARRQQGVACLGGAGIKDPYLLLLLNTPYKSLLKFGTQPTKTMISDSVAAPWQNREEKLVNALESSLRNKAQTGAPMPPVVRALYGRIAIGKLVLGDAESAEVWFNRSLPYIHKDVVSNLETSQFATVGLVLNKEQVVAESFDSISLPQFSSNSEGVSAAFSIAECFRRTESPEKSFQFFRAAWRLAWAANVDASLVLKQSIAESYNRFLTGGAFKSGELNLLLSEAEMVAYWARGEDNEAAGKLEASIGEILVDLGRGDEGRRKLRGSLNSHPDKDFVQLQIGDFSGASELLENRLPEVDEGSAEYVGVLNNLLMAYINMGRVDLVRKYRELAIASLKGIEAPYIKANMLDTISQATVLLGKTEDALTWSTQVVNLEEFEKLPPRVRIKLKANHAVVLALNHKPEFEAMFADVEDQTREYYGTDDTMLLAVIRNNFGRSLLAEMIRPAEAQTMIDSSQQLLPENASSLSGQVSLADKMLILGRKKAG